MNKHHFQNQMEGHRVEAPSNRDLEQRLTYQQLLNLNHDLTKENMQLKDIGNRLGQQLRGLHSQFEIRPINTNNDLYNSIGSHPILHQYQQILTPLFDAYDSKIQEFENGFETINAEFINLQKKYEQLAEENEKLRVQLSDKIKQLVDVYKNGSPDKLGADFGQLILQQINQKQKYLNEENVRLARGYEKYQSQFHKSSGQLEQYKFKDQENSNRIKTLDMTQKKLEKQLAALKQNIFQIQVRNNQLESEKKKIENDLQRASSQINQLNKDKDGLLKNHQNLKIRYEKDVNLTQDYDESKTSERYRSPEFEDTLKAPTDDSYKKLNKLQKQYDVIVNERNRLRSDLQQYQILSKQNAELVSEGKRQRNQLQKDLREVRINEQKSKKLLQRLQEKAKNDLKLQKQSHEQQKESMEDQYYSQLEEKQKQMRQLQSMLEQEKLKKNQLEELKIINSTLNKENNKGARGKDSERVAEKLKEKLNINQELFNEQLQIVSNDNAYLKDQAEKYKSELKDRNEELRRLKQELQKIKKELSESKEQKASLLEQIKRVRNEYEGNLKDKERLFDHKIQQIKLIVEQSDKRRKSEKQKVADASLEYKRVLQEIRNTYEERIRALQNENASYNKMKKSDFC